MYRGVIMKTKRRYSCTPAERKRRSDICIARNKGNNHFLNFFNKMPVHERALWSKRRNAKTSAGIKKYYKKHPEHREVLSIAHIEYYKKHPEKLIYLRDRMLGNSFRVDYLIKHPINVVPDWSKYTPYHSVPPFIPIPNFRMSINQSTKYFCEGVSPVISTIGGIYH